MTKEINDESLRRTITDPKARIKSDNSMGCEHDTNRIPNKAAGSTPWGSPSGKQPGLFLLSRTNVSIPWGVCLGARVCRALSGVWAWQGVPVTSPRPTGSRMNKQLPMGIHVEH